MSSLHARTSPNDISPVALAGAAGGAAAGALLWAAISYVTGYEIGYVAWGIGLLVGFAAVRLGGRGSAVAAAAAGLTLISIFGGKLLSTQLIVQKGLAASLDETFTPAFYQEMQRDAEDWAALPDATDEEAVRLFMVEHAYTMTADPAQLTGGELAVFHAVSVPELERLAAERPPFEAWRRDSIAEAKAAFAAENSLVGLVVEDLNAIDLLFAFLAVSTAFGLVSRAGSGPQDAGTGSGGDELRRAA